MTYDNVLDAIGHTPLVRLRPATDSGAEIYAKMEMQNFFGMKDRVAKQAILHARETGELQAGAPVVESSSGTMALGLALVGRALGHPVHIVTDPRIDSITQAKLTSLGATVHVVEKMSGNGWQSARLERLAMLMDQLPGAFWPQQYDNPQNPLAYQPLADELAAELGRVDVLVAATGSGGSMCGTAVALRKLCPRLRTVAVDCVGSVLFGQPDWPQRLQSGLGNSLMPGNLDYSQIDEVHWLNDREAFCGTLALAADQGIFGGNTSGSVYRVLRYVQACSPPVTRIVGIFADRGDRYTRTIYDKDYWTSRGLLAQECSDQPVLVDAGTAVSSWSYQITQYGRRGNGAADDIHRVEYYGDRDDRFAHCCGLGAAAGLPH
jgi:S-sulfo-L-cysteine synthase (3-phospho-L-serine-dependent)